MEVTDVRVERLQEITAADIRLEGYPTHVDWETFCKCYREEIERDLTLMHLFRESWDNLNAKHGYSWESNPWVWVVSFKRVEKKEQS